MHFIIQYSITTLIILGVVLVYNLRVRNFNTFKNNVFIVYTILGLLVNILDLVRCILTFREELCPCWLITIMNCLFYTVLNIIPVAYAIYCMAVVDYYHLPERKSSTLVNISLIVPVVLTIVYIWISPFFPNKDYAVFYLIKNTNLIQNGYLGYLFMYITAFWYILCGLHVIVVYRKNLENTIIFHIVFTVVLMIATLAAQRYFPYVRIISVGLAMSTLDFSLYVQRSEDIYDSKYGVLNKNGFQILLNHQFKNAAKFHIYSIVMDDAAFYRTALGVKERQNIEACILNALKSNFKTYHCCVFRLTYGRYAVVIADRKKKLIGNAAKFIQDQIDIRWGFSSLDLDLSFRVCVMESFIDVTSYREVSDLIDFFATNKKFKGQFLEANSMDLFRVHSHSYLENAIYKGLENNRFEVFYQPIYSVAEKKLVSAEALIRLKDVDGNFVSPEEFIPVAEQNGTIFEIGKFVFTSVCEFLSEINTTEYNIKKIDINLSVIQCIQEDLYKQLIGIRNRYKVPANLINIEITETATTNSPEVLLKNMKLLEADGIELSLDDYGSGNSNVSYLLNLPFKMIKIDKGIVWQAFENERASIALKSSIDMIKALGLTTLAEGIETDEQARVLQELGCDYLQGYFYSRPVSKDKFLEIMKK